MFPALHTTPLARPLADDFDSQVLQLHRLARAVAGKTPGVRAALQHWLDGLQGAQDPRHVGLYVFGAALAQRLAGQTAAQANLYLSRFEVPQIELFNLLGRAVPFVGLATQVCNQALRQALSQQAHPVLIDVGIGTGRQVLHLLPQLAAQGTRSLTVIGIEPSGWALQVAQADLTQCAESLGISLHMVPIEGSVEALDATAWHAIRTACAGTQPVVNASFALHHIADTPTADGRQQVLALLHALEPALLVLAEPDVDHLEPALYARFRNCWAHFSAVFATLDQLPLRQAERDAPKVGFFGREIADILGQPEGQRSERHESAASWLRRLTAAGFDVQVGNAPAALQQGPVRLVQRAYHLSLDAGDEPVVALFTARPHHALQ